MQITALNNSIWQVIRAHRARFKTKREGDRAECHHEENIGFLRDDVISALD